MRVNVQMYAALENLIARFSNAPQTVRLVAHRVMDDTGRYMWGKVRQNLQGGILQVRTGALLNSIQYEVIDNAAGVTARVFSDGSAPHARILETGGVIPPHLIVVQRAKALRFMGPYGLMFAHTVHHPGAKMPAFGYMRQVLMTERTNVNRMVRTGMKEAYP